MRTAHKPTAKPLRDKAQRGQKKASKQFEIDEAASHLSRDEAQVVPEESGKGLEKEKATRLGKFLSTPKKKGETAPPPDPHISSSYNDSDRDDMISEAGPADPPAPPTDPVPDRMTRLAAKLEKPPTFNSQGDDLKAEAFETWYTSVRLYINLTGVTPNTPGYRNY